MKKHKIWGDLILAAVILIIAALWFIIPRSGEAQAVIYVDGREYATIRLYGAERTFEVNNVTIYADGNGNIAFTHSPCPDQLCVKAGNKSKKGSTVACVPQGVVIKIEAVKVDGVTG